MATHRADCQGAQAGRVRDAWLNLHVGWPDRICTPVRGTRRDANPTAARIRYRVALLRTSYMLVMLWAFSIATDASCVWADGAPTLRLLLLLSLLPLAASVSGRACTLGISPMLPADASPVAEAASAAAELPAAAVRRCSLLVRSPPQRRDQAGWMLILILLRDCA